MNMLPLWLVALHMLGDYLLQTAWMANNKLKNWMALTYHVLVYSGPFFWLGVFYGLGLNASLFYFMVASTHWILDCRRWVRNAEWPPGEILADQSLHVLTLAILGTMFFGR